MPLGSVSKSLNHVSPLGSMVCLLLAFVLLGTVKVMVWPASRPLHACLLWSGHIMYCLLTLISLKVGRANTYEMIHCLGFRMSPSQPSLD